MLHRNSVAFSLMLILLVGMISCSGSGNPLVPDNSIDNSPQHGDQLTLAYESDPVIHSILDDGQNYATGEVLLSLKDGVIDSDSDGSPTTFGITQGIILLNDHGLSIIRVIDAGWGTVYRLAITDSIAVRQKVAELKALPEVDIAEPNYIVYFCEVPYVPNDYFWENDSDGDDDPRGSVWEQFGPSKIGASVVWNEEKGSEDVVVCVLDTGVQWWHEDLENSMWHNEDEIPANGIDDDLNGFTDDYYGWDTDGNDPDITEYNSYFHYHGTACAGIVAATQDNTVGCSGVAPGVRVMGVKCDLGGGGGYTSSVIEGVTYATDNGAHFISMSFRSYDDSEAMHNSMDYAYANGVLPIGAAGNEDTTSPAYPSSWDSVIQVGAAIPFLASSGHAPRDETRISSSFGYPWGSNYGPTLEVMGYGEYYITTYGSHYSAYWDGIDPGFFNGTSCATPMVAGAFALVKSYFPGESHEWLRERMRETADDIHSPGFDINSGYGRVDVIRACYGVDRYADQEDVYGFVDFGSYDGQMFDSLNNQTEGNYIDTEDFYKITSTANGYLLVDLDIFNWGEDLDLEIYSDPSMAPEFLLDQSTGDNHADSSTEHGGTPVAIGETFYIRVFAPDVGDSSAYGINFRTTENRLDITSSGTYDPGFIHNGKQNTLLGYLDLDASFEVHLSQLIVSSSGTMPADKISAVKVYFDSNHNGVYNTGDTLLGSKTNSGTNRFVISGLNLDMHYTESPFRFFILADLGDITEDADFSLHIENYKDISTAEGVDIPYDQLPVTYGPFSVGVDTEPPYWPDTVGVQSALPKYEAALVQWNSAEDLLTPPVKYNIYWTQMLPFNFLTADKSMDVGFWSGSGYDHAWQVNGLVNGETFYVAVRAEDEAGNEESNTVYLEVTPDVVTDPTNPTIVGSVNTPGNAWEVFADPVHERVFVADFNGGVAIIDVSSPSAPVIAGTVPGSEITGVEYDGTYVYAAGAAGLTIIDPDAVGGPEVIALAPITDALDVHLVGNWAYVTDFGSNIYPVDILIPEIPVIHTAVAGGSIGYGIDSSDDGAYLYIAFNNKPRAYSLSNPASPTFLNSFGGNGAYEIDVIGNRIYVTYWGGNRFSIYDRSNPANPQFVGYYTSESGSAGADIVWLNGYIYFGTNNHHIEVVNVDNWDNTFKIGTLSTDGPDGMDTDGFFIYSAENESGLKIIL